MDRIDMWIEVPNIDYAKLSAKKVLSDHIAHIRKMVEETRQKQVTRFSTQKTNSEMSVSDIDAHITLTPSLKNILNSSAKHFNLSARGYHRVLKLARTIADLENSENIEQPHLLEALQYRQKRVAL